MVIAYACLIIVLSSILIFTHKNVLYFLTAFFCLAGILWAQFNSRRWLYLAIIALPMSPTVLAWRWRNAVSTELGDAIAIAACVVWGVDFLVNKPKRKGYDIYVFGALLAYVISATISSFAGYYVHWQGALVFNALGHLGKWVAYVLLFYIIYTMFKTDEDIKNMLRAVLIAFVIGSFFSISNYFLFRSAANTEVFRVSGLMKGLNGYGVTLGVILVFYLNLVIQGKAKEIFPSWLILTACVPIFIALIITFSRTGWVTMFGGLAAICFLRGRRYLGALIIIIIMGGFFLLGKPVEERVEETFEERPYARLPVDLAGRDDIWLTSLDKLNDSGFWGVGYGNFGQTVMGTTAHDNYIEIAGESGLLGLLTFMFFCFRWFKAQLFLYRNHPQPFYRECAYGGLVCLACVVMASLAGEYFYFPSVIAALIIFYGAARVSFQMELEKIRQLAADKSVRPIRYNYKLGT